MKKLIISAAILCATSFSYGAAASWNWAVSGSAPSQVWYDKTGTALGENTAIFLFDAAEVSQADLLASIRGGNSIDGYVKDSKLNASSKLVAVSDFEHGENSAVTTHNYNFYMAAIKGDDIFITDSLNKNASALAASVDVLFSGIATSTKVDFTTDATAAFSSAGWYSAAVPEPTSGLMILLGVGLMALRRRRS